LFKHFIQFTFGFNAGEEFRSFGANAVPRNASIWSVSNVVPKSGELISRSKSGSAGGVARATTVGHIPAHSATESPTTDTRTTSYS